MKIISLLAYSFLTVVVLFIALTVIVYYISAASDAIKRRKRNG